MNTIKRINKLVAFSYVSPLILCLIINSIIWTVKFNEWQVIPISIIFFITASAILISISLLTKPIRYITTNILLLLSWLIIDRLNIPNTTEVFIANNDVKSYFYLKLYFYIPILMFFNFIISIILTLIHINIKKKSSFNNYAKAILSLVLFSAYFLEIIYIIVFFKDMHDILIFIIFQALAFIVFFISIFSTKMNAVMKIYAHE
jgi:hypothetical protein